MVMTLLVLAVLMRALQIAVADMTARDDRRIGRETGRHDLLIRKMSWVLRVIIVVMMMMVVVMVVMVVVVVVVVAAVVVAGVAVVVAVVVVVVAMLVYLVQDVVGPLDDDAEHGQAGCSCRYCVLLVALCNVGWISCTVLYKRLPRYCHDHHRQLWSLSCVLLHHKLLTPRP